MELRLNRIIKSTEAAGPGRRYALWAQGCERHCQGCMLPETWPLEGGFLKSPDELLDDIIKQEVEGITFLGGEPFLQAEAFALLAEKARESGLSVVTFTGFLYEELGFPSARKLLAATDLLIDGPFIKEKKDFTLPWRGSSNQRYLFLTEKYNMAIVEKCVNKIELRIATDGTAFMNGMGDFEKLKDLLQ